MGVANFLLVLSIFVTLENYCASDRSFVIDYPNNQFLKDGKPFRYVSGTLHYFKVPSVLWRDRMTKYRAAGLNAVQTYIEWRSHEPERGVYDFSGDNDIITYLKTAQELGLVVILRTGPFIDAERDLGGLPYWLLKLNPKMALRTMDPSYMSEVEKWFSLLLPLLNKMLYKNGGPVIMVQVENEYGSYYACDFAYMTRLRDLHYHYFGNDVVLFTTDGNDDYFLKCGKIDGIFATIDFGSDEDPVKSFNYQRIHQEFGPNVNSEYYTGWIDHWDWPHSTATTQAVCNTLDIMLSINASVNLYPLHGGTSFGFNSGANLDDNRFDPCITSYDFDAPLTEAGDPTDKYYAVRKVIGKYLPLPNMTLPVPSPKMELQPILMTPIANVFDKSMNQTPIPSLYPLTFEQLSQSNGFILYSTNITFHPSDPAVLTVTGLADRAQVFVDGEYSGTLSRTQGVYQMDVDISYGSRLDLFVENQGRLAYGSSINESKGITTNVTIGPVTLKNWNHYKFFGNWTQAIDNLQKIFSNGLKTTDSPIEFKDNSQRIPTFFGANFVLPNIEGLPLDTFLRLDGWRKGLAFLNGFNLGRYWPIAGPQVTLYTPAHLFKPYPESNNLLVFELEGFPSESTVQFVKTHVLNGTTPYTSFQTSRKCKLTKTC